MSILLAFSLHACVVMINENNYRGLDESEKEAVKPFNIDLLRVKVTNSDTLFLYEINSRNIHECTLKSTFTWVHLWKPYCKAEYCQDISYFSDIANKHNGDGLELLLISESYDFKSIQKCRNNSKYNRPVFVLQDSYYGHKKRANRLKLFNDLNQDNNIETKFGFDDFLFKDSIPIFIGNNLNAQQLDSLIKNNINDL